MGMRAPVPQVLIGKTCCASYQEALGSDTFPEGMRNRTRIDPVSKGRRLRRAWIGYDGLNDLSRWVRNGKLLGVNRSMARYSAG
jgi:hypothetical protein